MSVNKVILVGNLGQDPEVSYSASGTAVARFSLATSERWTKDGQKQERTDWHRCVAFGKLAEIISQYLRKGSQIYVEGSIQYGKYTDRDGNERYTTDINVREMQMLGGRAESNTQQSAPREMNNAPSFDDDFGVPF